ncbi:MAG TPA: septum formation initiator family protein [Verrucomicrobia bacterium]|nr:septum formation initiator family protein [Verrucomicrobiota bacterium]HOB32120.1 septum formation initiator family protein [Verrucomicrobiota bacterium]HOP97248.1 septum formation initiator family protein [Verrucomicrobiota bacterium]HPU56316.1 septum formation initiator family protein [Verrucomicrobiota bacterium]
MARNRRYQSAAIRFGPAVKAFVLCLLVGGSGVGYVWQKSQISQLGDQIRKRERELDALRRENEALRRQLAILSSPRALEARARELNLGLVPPQASQIWRLPEPVTEWSEPVRDRQYAAQSVD